MNSSEKKLESVKELRSNLQRVVIESVKEKILEDFEIQYLKKFVKMLVSYQVFPLQDLTVQLLKNEDYADEHLRILKKIQNNTSINSKSFPNVLNYFETILIYA
jgi:hypothetical protein